MHSKIQNFKYTFKNFNPKIFSINFCSSFTLKEKKRQTGIIATRNVEYKNILVTLKKIFKI